MSSLNVMHPGDRDLENSPAIVFTCDTSHVLMLPCLALAAAASSHHSVAACFRVASLKQVARLQAL